LFYSKCTFYWSTIRLSVITLSVVAPDFLQLLKNKINLWGTSSKNYCRKIPYRSGEIWHLAKWLYHNTRYSICFTPSVNLFFWNAIMLSVIMLRVVAPFSLQLNFCRWGINQFFLQSLMNRINLWGTSSKK